ncbi:hypothetical protein [Maribacter sp. R86514]|uniref:hypothetical protein n=1 Tax=Maribacter sp. R86514 TaxID=3093854 RepID=UPI0037CA91E3
MNSAGANWRLLSATHIAKSFCFVFSFPCLKQNPKDFAVFIKIHKPFGFAPKSALRLGIVPVAQVNEKTI